MQTGVSGVKCPNGGYIARIEERSPNTNKRTIYKEQENNRITAFRAAPPQEHAPHARCLVLDLEGGIRRTHVLHYRWDPRGNVDALQGIPNDLA
jgi:hypothetical protein